VWESGLYLRSDHVPGLLVSALSTLTYIFRRIADDWKFMLSIFLGMAIATTLVAGAPVYINALERQGIDTAIDNTPQAMLGIAAYAAYVPLDRSSLQDTEQALKDATQLDIQRIYRGHERYLSSRNYDVRLPREPLQREPDSEAPGGYLRSLTNLEDHVTFVDGRMATGDIVQGPEGPLIEGVIDSSSALEMNLRVGDSLVLTQSRLDPTAITASVVGVFRPTDLRDEFWQHYWVVLGDMDNAGLFVTRDVLLDGLGKTYPGGIVSSLWSIYVDKERLKDWSISEGRSRLAAFQETLSLRMTRSTVISGIDTMFKDFEERSFFSRVPVLMMLAIMLITILYFLSMLVSYLVGSRESEFALLRSRGAGTGRFLQMFALEGLVLTVFAVVIAPFLAMALVALAGFLPYFSDITGGSILPVEFHWEPFAAAAGTGVLSLGILVVPGLLGSRAGLVIHRLRSSRPPSVPFFQRYYLDIGFLMIGGLVFWELNTRGHIVSGGLFEEVQVNEVLLLAPVLVLVVVALLFMRLFPLFLRFIAGESPMLLHVVGGTALLALAPAIAAREVSAGDELGWLAPVALLILLGVVYWGTHRAHDRRLQIGGLVVQSGLVVAVVLLETPDPDHVSFVPTVGLIAIVPAQLVFRLLTYAGRLAPVWLSIGLWHMGRNPLQYTWLVLLLVLVTGLGYLATTVGGTLSRSQEERILYGVAADYRVGGISNFVSRDRDTLRATYENIPGVSEVALAFRTDGRVGALGAGGQFEVFGVESSAFQYMSWYRDDFSVRPLVNVMQGLQYNVLSGPVLIPDGATSIGMWVKPGDQYPNVNLWAVIQDVSGAHHTITLGKLGPPEWQRVRAEIPTWLRGPLEVASIQLHELGFGPVGTPGSLSIDDIHVLVGSGDEEVVLDDFEGQNGTVGWTALATSMISTDSISATTEDPYRGNRAGIFKFGKETDRGIRGFYHSPSGGPLPVVASTSFLVNTGTRVGQTLVVTIEGRLVTIRVQDTVEYFPTLDPRDGGFILAELDSLTRVLNIAGTGAPVGPSELFIEEDIGTNVGVRDFVLRLAPSPSAVRDRDFLLSSVRLDPLITAGWKAMVLLSLAIIGITAGLGYATYLLSFADRSRREMGFLRAFGFTRRQMLALLSLEHLAIAFIGLGLGTWAGLEMSSTMVESVAVTHRGDQVVPPIILTTDWSFMLIVYGMLIGIFLFSLYRLTSSMLRVNMHAASRMEI
jgi:ABC-type multidrug transport system fused ATPase/permease subunit